MLSAGSVFRFTGAMFSSRCYIGTDFLIALKNSDDNHH
ncbi:hypothetical protein LTSERUB_4965 [Salmonella enterica subsp. enterica serovar Rubislaw str. A4-653]|uniref:Uncharacterized protein n=1 Tax=Salmonella enterica subsp. enterica serovar Rubislaw str. A4-653 TaxID=913081 RepID=G5QPL0_SALRU|nr:hypothetical protein LTSERUB_4965 [Salmonella enterica subsp. enterica serovar Rubislaw str. A4-653]